MSRRRKPVGLVALVGAGPGDPGLLTVRGAEALGSADVVAADTAAFGALLGEHSASAEVIDVRTPDAELAKALVRHAKDGRRVVYLTADDPLFAANEFAALVARSGVPFEVIPGITTALAVPEYAGIPLLDKRNHAFAVVDLGGGEPNWSALAGVNTLVVLGAGGTVGKVAAALTEHGANGDTPVAVTEGGTTTAQHTVVSTLDALERDTAKAGISSAAVVVVGDVVRHRDKLSWYETRPLFGWRVLIPRTREQAGSVSLLLRQYGAVPVEVPTIAVEPPRTPTAMERAITGLVSGRYQWIAFTSVNAFKAVRERLEDYGLDARAFAGVRIAAVGDQTAAAVRGYGIEPDLVPSKEQSSEGLLAEWPAYEPGLDPIDRVLLPRADIATETLASGLQERGWQVDDVTAYRTVRAAPPSAEIRDAIKSGGFDAVLFTSSSTVRNLVGIAGKPHTSTVIAVIGPQTAQTVEEHGLRVDVMADEPSVTALVQGLAEHALQRRADGDVRPSMRRRPPTKK